MVPPVLHALETAEVPYSYVDIRQEPEAAERVRSINGGNESVPTLVFPDGSSLTEPGLGTLRTKLQQQGYGSDGLGSVSAEVGYRLRNPVILFTLLAMLAMAIAILVFR